MFFASSDVNWLGVSKSVVTTMRFTIDDKHRIKWMWVKKLRRKTLAQDVFDRRWSLSARSFDLCSEVGIVWLTATRTRVSDVTAVTFSVKCFNPLKLYPLSWEHLQKVVCFIHFIYLLAFNNNLISNGKCYCCNDTFTDVWFASQLTKNM